MELEEQLQKKQELLDKAVNELATNGYDFAKKERDYKIQLCKTALELRDQGMPATLINQVIYGYGDVPKYRFERDTARTKYEANQEFINTTKLEIRLLDSQISREFTNVK